MKKVKVTARTTMVGSETTNEFEVEDDTPIAFIEEQAFQAAMEMVDWNYTIGEED